MSYQQPILSIHDARKSYGKVEALCGVSLDLFPGELLGFLGPNGAGKTTLIRCLAGRSRLDAGSFEFHATVKGRPVRSRRAQRDLLGVVPQSIAVYDDLTALQNLKAFGRLHGVRGRRLRLRVSEALGWSNLTDRRHELVKAFSGGMKRRLNIACSVLHQPQVLLLDEPTVGVDPQSRERIYEMLDDLRAAGAAILLTTHQLDEAQFRCDRVAIVDQGRVIQVGTFEQLVEDTVGDEQRLRVRFQEAPPKSLPGFTMDAGGHTGSCVITDVTAQLPRLVSSLQRLNGTVDHIVLERPTLQDVFLHLTGKELRE